MSDSELATPSAPSGEPGVATRDDIAAASKALEAAGSDSSPEQTDSTDSSREPVATAPDAPSADPAPKTPGPIPFERHEAALKNAREKAKAEADAEVRQRFGWAEKLDQRKVDQATRLYEWLESNPQGFAEFLQQQLAQSQPKVEEPPTPDLKAEDGTPVYSAPQLQKFLEWQRAQMLAEVRQQYEPIRQQVELERLERQSKTQATNLLTEARTNWPEFKSLEPEIKHLMVANPGLTLENAYIHAFRQSGLTKLREQFRQEYEGSLQDKAAAATTKPGAPAVTPRKYSEMSTREIVESVYRDMTKTGR